MGSDGQRKIVSEFDLGENLKASPGFIPRRAKTFPPDANALSEHGHGRASHDLRSIVQRAFTGESTFEQSYATERDGICSSELLTSHKR